MYIIIMLVYNCIYTYLHMHTHTGMYLRNAYMKELNMWD